VSSDPVTPLWRAAQVFRLLSCLYAVTFQLTVTDDLTHPLGGWAVLAALLICSVVCAIAYLQGAGRRRAFVAAEVIVVVALMASTEWVASDRWVLDNQSLPTTLWATNAVLSAAILAGPVAGMLTGLLVMATGAALKGYVHIDLARNATLVVELAVGLAVGMAAQTALRAHTELQRAARLSAAIQERERLSRQVHDGAIQVLALMARHGGDLGDDGARLASLAGEQERALRRLISTGDVAPRDGTRDLAVSLRRLATDRVSVSVPPGPVALPADVADELCAAVVNALDNTAAHAGAAARAWVLLEDLGDTVTVSVRDDGPGIPAGRLAAAAGEGRVGVAKSIVGRLESLGGTATLTTAPDAGTEWELAVPSAGRSSR
jgi:signal transduction histidine kinase